MIFLVSEKFRPPARGSIIQDMTMAWRRCPSAGSGRRSWKKWTGLGFLMRDHTRMLRSKTDWVRRRQSVMVRAPEGSAFQQAVRNWRRRLSTPSGPRTSYSSEGDLLVRRKASQLMVMIVEAVSGGVSPQCQAWGGRAGRVRE